MLRKKVKNIKLSFILLTNDVLQSYLRVTIRQISMKSNLFLRVIIFLFCIQIAKPVYADVVPAAEAQKWVEDKGQQLLIVFGESDIVKKYAALDEMLVQYIDLDYVSKFVMGKYWRQMSEEQQSEYQELFKRYALSVYKSFPLDFNAEKIKFEIIKAIPEKNRTAVRAKVNLEGIMDPQQNTVADIFVDFLVSQKNNQIKIIDLKLGESSLILSYRSRFYEMIAKDDDDVVWFLEDLADITEAAERTIAEKLHETEY